MTRVVLFAMTLLVMALLGFLVGAILQFGAAVPGLVGAGHGHGSVNYDFVIGGTAVGAAIGAALASWLWRVSAPGSRAPSESPPAE